MGMESWVGNWPFWTAISLSLGTAIVAVAQFLDRNLSDEWRVRIATLLLTGQVGRLLHPDDGRKPWKSVARTVSSFLRAMLQGHSATHFIKISVLLSLLIILIAFIYYYLSGDEAAQLEIVELFESSRSFWLRVGLPLVGTLVIDVIAAFQTLLFVELIGKCRAIWQVIVLIYGNLLLSVGLFSVAFPMVIVCLLFVENAQTYAGKLILQPIPQSQTPAAVRHATLFTVGREGYNARETNSEVTADTIAWSLNTQFVGPDGEEISSHSMSALTNRSFEYSKLQPFIADAFTSR
jgi:hypothetical protein